MTHVTNSLNVIVKVRCAAELHKVLATVLVFNVVFPTLLFQMIVL